MGMVRGKTFRLMAAAIMLAMLLGGCSISAKETRYFAVANSDEVNVYKLKINASTTLTEGKYASGWYPRASVDSLTGAVNAEQAIEDLEIRRDIEKKIDEAVKKAYDKWLATAGNSGSTPRQREKVLETLRNVVSYPTDSATDRGGMRYIEYRPAEGIVTRHADEKMVFIVSSNPEKILGAINSFTQSTDNALAIKQLSGAYSDQTLGEYSATAASINAIRNYGALIDSELESLQALPATDKDTRNQKAEEIAALIEMLESME